MKGFRLVSEEEFDKVLHSKNQVIKETSLIFAPPVSFFWDNKLDSMAFGRGAFGAIVHKYNPNTGSDEPDQYWLKEEPLDE